MAHECQLQIRLGEASAVICHADRLCSALLQLDVNPSSTGIQAVLDEFLDHRERALDDLAGCDLVDDAG